MTNPYAIWRIALYETKLLFRSWGFRIFSLLGLLILALLNITVATSLFFPSPFFLRSLSGSLPLTNLKLLNIYQGIIAAFLATEFFKRDRRHDTNQVVLARSFSNADYLLGKLFGILTVFAVLNLAVLFMTFVIHFFFSKIIFAWQPYFLFALLISVPTLVFVIGLSFLLVALIRSQAVVFVVMLAHALLVLVFIGPRMFFLLDSYAFYQPLMYSDFIGLGNLHQLLLVRGFYLLLGLSFITATTLLIKRLRQSVASNIGAGAISITCMILAIILGYSYHKGKVAALEYRQSLKSSSQAVSHTPSATVTECDINLHHKEDKIHATAKLVLVNKSTASLDEILLSLNPGLSVQKVASSKETLRFRKDNHLLWIAPSKPLGPGELISLSVSYSGIIDERYCYLDIDDNRLEDPYRMWLFNIPKRYTLVTSNYVLLTAECGWYPISGLPQGAAFPSTVKQDYTKYSLTATIPEGMVAISQGTPDIQPAGNQQKYTFRPEKPLPQISLTIGNYEHRQIKVDNVLYSLYILPGHDYFSPHFKEISGSLSKIIRELKDEYEVLLGLEYPYSRLSLVEVPIQFFSYKRFWTVAQEMVQPQLVFLPEMGTLCSGADFQGFSRFTQRRGGRSNMPFGAKEIQGMFLTNFVRFNLFGTQAGFRNIMRFSPVGRSLQADLDPQYEIFSNYVSYVSHLSSSRWPILNHALESYLQARTSSSPSMFFRLGRGLSSEEKTSQVLKDHSLHDLIENHSLEGTKTSEILKVKGKHLLSLLEAKLGEQNFVNHITEFLASHRFHDISEKELIDTIAAHGDVDLYKLIDSWYKDTQIPGYLIENFEIYNVIDGERTRTQVKLQVTNPTDVEGLLKISFSLRSSFSRVFRGGGRQSDYARTIHMPAQTKKEIGIIIDELPIMTTIDTFVSQNVPSVIIMRFRPQKPKPDEKPMDEEVTRPIKVPESGAKRVFIVDNEEAGFEIFNDSKENWLRRSLRKLFGSKEEQTPYMGMVVIDPPSVWMPATNQNFYGKFVRSGFLKKSGDGEDKVAWNVVVDDSGDYDIYFYYEGPMWTRRAFRRGRDRQSSGRGRQFRRPQFNPGKKYFLIYHEYGVDELEFDLSNAQVGWNLIGTYRLPSGKNRIELRDKNDAGYVTADAIKWARH